MIRDYIIVFGWKDILQVLIKKVYRLKHTSESVFISSAFRDIVLTNNFAKTEQEVRNRVGPRNASCDGVELTDCVCVREMKAFVLDSSSLFSSIALNSTHWTFKCVTSLGCVSDSYQFLWA